MRAKLVESADKWPWSGHNEYSGRSEQGLIDKGVAGELFGEGESGYKKYRRFLADGMAAGKRYEEDFHPSDSNPFLGSAEFKETLTDKTLEAKMRKTKSVDDIIDEVSKRTGIHRAAIKR